MKAIDMSTVVYVLIMILVFMSATAFGQIKVIQFNAEWNKTNEVDSDNDTLVDSIDPNPLTPETNLSSLNFIGDSTQTMVNIGRNKIPHNKRTISAWVKIKPELERGVGVSSNDDYYIHLLLYRQHKN